MLTKILRIWVHAQLETVWNVLMESIVNPQKYTPDLEVFRILDEAEGAVFREMTIRDILYREKVSVNHVSREICRELLDHPAYVGKIVIKAVPSSVQNPMAPIDLQFFLDLEPISGSQIKDDEETGIIALVKEEQRRITKESEKLERRS